jgi:conjugal transfer pilus assembly protein TraL
MREVDIPRYIDAQPQFFWWELDEFALAIGLMGVGMLTETLSIMFVVIVVVSAWMKRFKSNNLDGAIVHIAYKAGLLPLNHAYRDGLAVEFFA